MTPSIDNYKLRDALLTRGFTDITSETRSTKTWRLQHPKMLHWISIKLAENVSRPMATAPLVIHPQDARRVQSTIAADSGITFEAKPYRGNSAKYDGVPGIALSCASLAAVDAFVAAATGAIRKQSAALPEQFEPDPTTGSAVATTASDDSILIAAATAEVDAEYAGRNIGATTRQRLIEARIGQGQFRNDMLKIWGQRCAVTGCSVATALVASHAIAWRDDKNPEVRLDPYNGLLLTASIDRLFDQGCISFAEDGRLLPKPGLSAADLAHLGVVASARLRQVHPRHHPYLAAHRARHGF